MELLLGSHVREHASRVGRLAGFELEPANRRIRRIIFSPDGNLGTHAMTRPIAAIGHVHDNGEIELRADIDIAAMPAVPDVVLWSRAIRVRTGNGHVARLVGVEINPADGSLMSVRARAHWWSRAVTLDGAGLDCSTPGEIRASSRSGTRAA